jgi:hypothetical protein
MSKTIMTADDSTSTRQHDQFLAVARKLLR